MMYFCAFQLGHNQQAGEFNEQILCIMGSLGLKENNTLEVRSARIHAHTHSVFGLWTNGNYCVIFKVTNDLSCLKHTNLSAFKA